MVKMSHRDKHSVAKPDYSSNEIDKLIDEIRKNGTGLSQEEVNSKIYAKLDINRDENSTLIRKVQRRSEKSFEKTSQTEDKLEKSEARNQEQQNALKDAKIAKEKVDLLTDSHKAVKYELKEVKQENKKLRNKLKIINCHGRDKLWRKSNNVENGFENEKRHPPVIVPPLECKYCDEFVNCLEKQEKELEKKSKASS
jgi:hypothetical protein